MRDSQFEGVKAIVLALVLAFLLPAAAAAQAVPIPLTAADVFDPLNILGSGVVGAFTNPGTVTCPGADPTGDPMQPCPPGSRMNLRDVGWASRLLSSSALLAGWFHNVGNSVFDANATGRVWGTFRIDLDAGGAWQGNWVADRSQEGDVWVIHVRGTGRGVGGAVEGMHLRFTEAAVMPTFIPVVWQGTVEAEALAPPSR